MPRPLTFLLCALCASVVSLSSLAAQDDLVLRQLRQHGDYPAIERYCRQELKSTTSVDRRAELIAELAGSLAQQANTATDPARAESLWKETDQMLADFIKTNPKHARAILTQRQQVIYAFAHGEQLRQQADLTEKTQEKDAARAQLQRAEELAVALEKSVRQELDAYNAKTSRLPFAQLTSLSNDVPYRLAQIRLCLAQTHEPKTEFRAKLIEAAAKGFEFYTREGYSDDELIIRAHLGLAACRRLQKDFESALKTLVLIEQSKTAPVELKDEALTAHIRTLLDEDQPAAALALLRGRQKLSASLALEQIRTILTQMRQEQKRGERSSAVHLQKSAFEAMAVGEREHGVAWLSRAEGVLALLALPELLDDQPAALRLARACESVQRPQKAASAYVRAAEVARMAGQIAQAFDLELKASQLLIASGQHQAGFERLQGLSQNAPSAEKAAQASAAATAALLGILQKGPDEATQTQLSVWVEEHVRRFPNDPTTSDAHFLAGALASEKKRYKYGLAHYMAVPVDHVHFGDALVETVGIVQLLRMKGMLGEQGRWTELGIKHLDRCANEAHAKSTLEAVQPSLQIARAALLTWPGATVKELDEAQRLLVAAKRPQGLAEWEKSLAGWTRLLLMANRGQGQEAARSAAEQLSIADARHLVDQVRSWMNSPLVERKQDFATLQLELVRRVLQEMPLDAEARNRFGRDEAWALARLGQASEAREKFVELRQQAPRDAALAEDHARLLMLLATEKDFTEAAGLWQMLSVTHKEGTEEWFEAKYQLAACYGKLGQKERALKIVKLTHDVWLADPEGDATRKAYQGRFRELERELSR